MLQVLVEGKWSLIIAHPNFIDIFPSASGFTTRSDIGPAREGPSAEAVAYVSPYAEQTTSNSLLVKHKRDAGKSLMSTRSSFKILTMRLDSLLE